MSDINTSDPTVYKKIRKSKGSHFTRVLEQRNKEQGGEQIKLNSILEQEQIRRTDAGRRKQEKTQMLHDTTAHDSQR